MYIEKAKELGQAILDCDEYTIMQAAEANLGQDPQAMELIKGFQEKQKNISELQEKDEEVSDESIQDINRYQAEMMQNKTLAAYMAAQQTFGKVMQEVNNVISKLINGEEACDSCGGDCSECS
jgi:cell fate (sporulation/competence/biofilm development) regulator YlbF (YheA/YmcA/DUF963 family)